MNNPIIQRELIAQLRTKKALAVQILLALVLVGLVLLRWPSDARVDTDGRQAQQVLQVFAYGMLGALVLLVPAFPATSVVREINSGTLALLLNSNMSRWSILLGKLAGAMGFSMLLLVLSLPAAAACYAMGGVDLWKLLALYGVLALLALECCAVAMLISSFSSRSEAALRVTYGAVLVLIVFTLAPDQFLRGLLQPPLSTVVMWIRSFSPIPAVMESLGQVAGDKGLRGAGGEVQRFMILSLSLITVCFLWTGSRLSYRLFDRARPSGKITDERSTAVRGFRRVMYLWFFDPQRRSGMIGPMTNPVMIKEFRCRRFGRSHWNMRLFALCLIVSLGLTFFTTTGTMNWGVAELGRIIILIQFALIVLLAPSLTGGLIAGERESGGWQILQTTPMSTGMILRGKLMSALFSLSMVLVATLPSYLVMMRIDSRTQIIVNCVIGLLLSTALALLASAAISSLFRNTAAATATSYAVLVGLCGGTMLFWLGRDQPFSHRTVEIVLMFNPLASTLSIVGARGFTDYNLIPLNWYIMGLACVLSLAVLVVQTWKLSRPQ